MTGKRIMAIEKLRAIAVPGVLFHHLPGNRFADASRSSGAFSCCNF
ncbi:MULTISPECIES: hypothetical protein [Pseudomonas]|jgi:peptidoglycan/LPS O-acetylase OafA/YrhL|nr:hypothetical protein [Pseudomonas rustica]